MPGVAGEQLATQKPSTARGDPAGVCKSPALRGDHNLCLQVKEMVLKISLPPNKMHSLRTHRHGSAWLAVPSLSVLLREGADCALLGGRDAHPRSRQPAAQPLMMGPHRALELWQLQGTVPKKKGSGQTWVLTEAADKLRGLDLRNCWEHGNLRAGFHHLVREDSPLQNEVKTSFKLIC